jgi:hypothetical protein
MNWIENTPENKPTCTVIIWTRDEHWLEARWNWNCQKWYAPFIAAYLDDYKITHWAYVVGPES